MQFSAFARPEFTSIATSASVALITIWPPDGRCILLSNKPVLQIKYPSSLF